MVYLKLQRDNTVVGATAIEDPHYLKYQERNHMIVMCPESEATGILANDVNTMYHLAGRDELQGVEEPLLDAYFIDVYEYELIVENLDDDDIINPPEPSEDDQEDDEYMTPEVMRTKILELSELVTELQDANEFLSDCLIEMSEVVYGE